MNKILVTSSITVDTITAESLERVRNGNTTGDRSTSSNFLHHVVFSFNVSILISWVDLVFIRNKASFTRVAVSAVLHSWAFLSIVKATSLVNRASSIRHFVLSHPFESSEVVSTMASHHLVIARDQNLRRDVDIGPGCFTGDFDSIRENGSGSMSPARSTVLRNVLVKDISQKVSSVSSRHSHVVPENFGGEVLSMK
jgi:hypothetical protein